MKNLLKRKNLLLFIPLTIIMLSSFLCMEQAKFISSIYNDHLLKQIIWFLLGFIILILLQKVKIKWLINKSFYLYLGTIILLILVLILGKEINGAKAWFNLGFFNFQPSELGKVALLLYLTKISFDFKEGYLTEFCYLTKSLLVVLIPSVLIFFEPDTGAIILYLWIYLGVLLFSGIRKRWFIFFIILFLTLIGIFIYLYIWNQELLIKLIGTSFFYRMDRLINFKDGRGLQLNNALITLGNSSWLGNGIKKDILYVPEFPTDFVFTLGTSIWGFIGSLVILGSYLLINIFLINKVIKNKNYNLLINGFLAMFLFEQVQNIGMNLGLLPIMGIPLPFLSYGGSNLIVSFILLGIILAI